MRFDRNIDIGSLDAEDDNYLLNSFVVKPEFDALLNTENQKCIILGRTGMGKSALIRKISESDHEVSRIKPEEMSLRYLSNSDILEYFRKLGISLDLFYKVLWKHVFIVEILKLYYGEDKVRVGNKMQSLFESVEFKFNKKKKNAIEYLRRWHDKFWESTEYRIRELEEKLRDSLKFTLGADAKLFEDFLKAKVGSETEEIIERSKKTEIIHKAQNVVNDIQLNEISTILDIIHKELLPKCQKKFFILIDDLDKYWVDKKIVYDLIVALLLSIKDVNNGYNLKIVTSLRLNLLQLSLQKANTTGFQREKFENMFLHLFWNENELKELLQKRLDTLYNISNEEKIKIEDILPKDPGRGTKTDGLTYMLNRSFFRPRDLISFFNKAIKYSRGASRITRESIHLAENDYSLERLNAIEDEWNENYSNLELYFNVIRNKPFRFRANEIINSDLEKFCKAVFPKVKSVEVRRIVYNGWMKGRAMKTTQHILNVLYKIGCVGIKQSTENKTVFSFHYNNTLDYFDLHDDYYFYVNPMLYKTLVIRQKDLLKPASKKRSND